MPKFTKQVMQEALPGAKQKNGTQGACPIGFAGCLLPRKKAVEMTLALALGKFKKKVTPHSDLSTWASSMARWKATAYARFYIIYSPSSLCTGSLEPTLAPSWAFPGESPGSPFCP